MKRFSIAAVLALGLVAAGTGIAQAQTAAAAATPPAKAAPPKKARLAPSAAKAVEEVTPVDDDPSITLSEAQLEIGKKVFVGEIPCELGAKVKLTPGRRDGFFVVQAGRQRFLMHPVESRTGAVRLEDPRREAIWIQLGNKSMLMSQKLGQRLADDCQSPDQATMAEALRKNPAPSLLDPAPSGPPAAR